VLEVSGYGVLGQRVLSVWVEVLIEFLEAFN